MKYFSITLNDQVVKSTISEDKVNETFLCVIEDYSSGYIYDNETNQVFNEVSKDIVAELGDTLAIVGYKVFEVVEEN